MTASLGSSSFLDPATEFLKQFGAFPYELKEKSMGNYSPLFLKGFFLKGTAIDDQNNSLLETVETIKTIAQEWIKKARTDTRILFSPTIRRFFASNPATPSRLFQKSFGELTCQEIEDIKQIAQIRIKDHFDNLTNPSLDALISTAITDAKEEEALKLIYSIISGPNLTLLSKDTLTKAFIFVTACGHIDALNLIIQSRCFNEIAVDDLEKALEEAYYREQIVTTTAIIGSTRIADISEKGLSFAFSLAEQTDNQALTNAIISSENFSGISVDTLGKILSLAGQNGHHKVLLAIIQSNRFAHIPSPFLLKAFLNAAEGGHVGAIQAILNAPTRVNEIPAPTIEEAFFTAAKKRHAKVLRCIMGSGHISIDALMQAYSNSVKNSDLEIATLISTFPLFNNIPNDVIENVLRTYLSKAVKTVLKNSDLERVRGLLHLVIWVRF